MGAGDAAHVIDQTQHMYPGLTKHCQSFGRINARYILGGSYQYRATKGHFSHQGGLWLSITRREINEQVVELSPVDHIEQLTDQHPLHIWHRGDRLLLSHKEANRHDFDAITQQGLQHLLGCEFLPLSQRKSGAPAVGLTAFAYTKHERDAR